MGLDTTHNCWHGSYGNFHRWRELIAQLSGHGNWLNGMRVANDEDTSINGISAGNWKHTPTDAILYLLAHSDCDGVIKSAHCTPLADRLEGLLPNIHDNCQKDRTLQFIKGLRKAAALGEDVEFG